MLLLSRIFNISRLPVHGLAAMSEIAAGVVPERPSNGGRTIFAYQLRIPSAPARQQTGAETATHRANESVSNDGHMERLDSASHPLIQYILKRKCYGEEMIRYSVLGGLNVESFRAGLMRKVHGELPFASAAESRAVAVMLGMACGDALGHTLEFFPVRYPHLASHTSGNEKIECTRFINKMMGGGRFMLKPGQWTDDTSMGLCLADSLLVGQRRGNFDPFDLMLRFEAWWHLGYNNAFGFDNGRPNKHSVGLGGNISLALRRFLSEGEPATRSGDKRTSGNGGIMRLAPVSITYFRSPRLAMKVARQSSLVTHQGEEAAECARLLALICVKAITWPAGIPNSRELLDSISTQFDSTEPSVLCLCRGEQEPGGDPNRNWEWRRDDYQYAPARAASQPGYVGSYAMDGMAMALHCVYTTTSLEEAILKCVNMAGDADTVGSITGQIAGAIYGCESIPQDWLRHIELWDNGGDIALKAWLLYCQREESQTEPRGDHTSRE